MINEKVEADCNLRYEQLVEGANKMEDIIECLGMLVKQQGRNVALNRMSSDNIKKAIEEFRIFLEDCNETLAGGFPCGKSREERIKHVITTFDAPFSAAILAGRMVTMGVMNNTPSLQRNLAVSLRKLVDDGFIKIVKIPNGPHHGQYERQAA